MFGKDAPTSKLIGIIIFKKCTTHIINVPVKMNIRNLSSLHFHNVYISSESKGGKLVVIIERIITIRATATSLKEQVGMTPKYSHTQKPVAS